MSELEKLQRMVAIYKQQVAQLVHENIALGVEVEYLNGELESSIKLEDPNVNVADVKLNRKGATVEEK